MPKEAAAYHARVRLDPATIPDPPAGADASRFEFVKAMALQDKKFADVSEVAEAAAVTGALKVAECPTCGKYLVYIKSGQKATVVNQPRNAAARLLADEQANFDSNFGAICSDCGTILRLP